MGRLEARFISAVVGLGILTAVSVVVADLSDAPEASTISTASVPPESREDPVNETLPPLPPTVQRSTTGVGSGEAIVGPGP